MTSKELINLLNDARKQPNQRIGQAISNLLYERHPDIYKQLESLNLEKDIFYCDDQIEMVETWLWQKISEK